jgi:polyisoprenoid-binding protein YceI
MTAEAQLATIVPAGTWLFDDERSTLDLLVDGFLGIKVLARSTRFAGAIRSHGGEADGLDLLIDSASVTTDVRLLDRRLRASVDPDRYPHVVFETSLVERIDDRLARVVGVLWFKGREYLLELAVRHGEFSLEDAGRVHVICSGDVALDPRSGPRGVRLAPRIRFTLSAYGFRAGNEHDD